MDTQKTLMQNNPSFQQLAVFSRLPWLGLMLVFIASGAFYLSYQHDQKTWEQLFAYHAKYLLDIETPFYVDYYNKRLQIEGLGKAQDLANIQNAIKANDEKTLTTYILLDRSFRDFLEQKSAIYFSPSESAYWLQHNQELKQTLHSLSSYRFAIIPERFITSPNTSSLLTYIFIDKQFINFISNIFIILLLCIILERFIIRRYLVGFIISFSLIYASAYLLIADVNSPPLSGLNALVYLLMSMMLAAFIEKHVKTRFHKQKVLLGLSLAVISAKITLDSVYLTISEDQLWLLILFCLIGILSAQTLLRLSLNRSTPEHTEKLPDTLPELSRMKYDEAMKGLSRFNFHYARQTLRQLIEKEPHSQQILESSYHLEKLVPDDALSGKLAQNRINEALVRKDYLAMRSIFEDIQLSAPNRSTAKKHIPAEYYLKILVLFIDNKDLEKAEHAFMFLELAGQKPLILEACKLLIKSFSDQQLLKKKAHYQALYQSLQDNA